MYLRQLLQIYKRCDALLSYCPFKYLFYIMNFCFALQEHSGRVFRLQFDQFQIVSSSHDDTILIWDFLDAETEEENKTQPNRTYTYVTRWASWHTTIQELASETNNWGANVSIISKYNNHFFQLSLFVYWRSGDWNRDSEWSWCTPHTDEVILSTKPSTQALSTPDD